MKFRLIDKDRKKQVHEGVMPKTEAPEIVMWGHRAFRLYAYSGENKDVPVYAETSAFKIGSF